MTHGVLCAVRGAVEALVVQALGGSGDRLEVTRRCADLAELLAAGAAGLGEVAVVSADLPGLDREAVNHLHGSAVRVIVLTDPQVVGQAERLHQLGVDAVVDEPDAERRVVGVVLDLLDGGDGASSSPVGGLPLQADARVGTATALVGSATVTARMAGPEPVPAGDHARSTVQDPALAARPLRGTVVAVWGPTGAPGRTTIALNLAAELAELAETETAGPPQRTGQGALLVDADTYGGTVAQMLGLLDEAPGVAAAARSASTGRLDARSLAALTPALDGGLRVLTGISRADRWPEVPASSLEQVWAAARELAVWTVVDCGFSLEQDEALSYDTRAPRRNAATLSALGEADLVVVVGSGDPIGLQRLVRGLDELDEAGVPASARHVVVNRVRASAGGPRPGEAITSALHRYAGVSRVHLVPDDRVACDGAVLAAQTLREHAPSSPARRAVVALADALLAVPRPGGAH